MLLAATVSTKPLTYLALGDSYTYGERVARKDIFPEQLARALKKRGFNFQPPTVIARTGWTTAELMAGIRAANPPANYDLVTLAIGVNNQYRGQPLNQYGVELQSLLSQAVHLAGGRNSRVLFVSIPDWGLTPFAKGRDTAKIRQQISEFNTKAGSLCLANHITFVNITQISDQVVADPALTAADGLHPSAKQYAEWVKVIAPKAASVLMR